MLQGNAQRLLFNWHMIQICKSKFNWLIPVRPTGRESGCMEARMVLVGPATVTVLWPSLEAMDPGNERPPRRVALPRVVRPASRQRWASQGGSTVIQQAGDLKL